MIIGRITVNNVEVLEVNAVPSDGVGTKAPRGSLALFDSGVIGYLYMKQGTADTAWTQVDTQETDDWNLDGNVMSGATPEAPNEFFGSNNNYDVIFKRNSLEIMRLASEGLLLGLNSVIGGKLQIGQALGGILTNIVSPAGAVGGANVVRITRQFKVQTTDDTVTPLISIEVPNTSRIQLKSFIGCNQHGGIVGSNGDGASYERTLDAKSLDTLPPTIEKWQTDFTSEDVNQYNVSEAVSGENVEISVQGEADRNIAWSAHVEYSIYLN